MVRNHGGAPLARHRTDADRPVCRRCQYERRVIETPPNIPPRAAENVGSTKAFAGCVKDHDDMPDDQRHHQDCSPALNDVEPDARTRRFIDDSHYSSPRMNACIVNRFNPAIDAVGLRCCGQCCSHD